MALWSLILLLMTSIAAPVSPATPDDVLALAPGDADVMLHLNVGAVGPPTWQAIQDLRREPLITANPQLAQSLDEAIKQGEQGLAMIRTEFGLDPLRDLRHATLWFTAPAPPSGEPQALIVIRGRFPADLATRAGLPTLADVNGVQLYGRPHEALAIKDDALLFGTQDWVKAALAGGNAPAAAPAWRALIARQPAAAAILTPGPHLLAAARDEGAPPSLMTLLEETPRAELALFPDGIDLTLEARSPDTHARHALLIEGSVELLRATHLGARGLTRTFLAIFPPEALPIPDLAAFITLHRDAIVDFIVARTGDGQFQANISTANNVVEAKLRAANAHEVMPPIWTLLPLFLLL